MIRRFQIEDLIHQDASGVVFRAFDTETNQTVAVRRFFPFGPDGGGLHADEQTAYNIALGRLAGLSHPALRAVICGGCDPVDGIPFIATEWIEGDPLQPFLDQSPLAPEIATEVITQALEVCELLSHVLAEEAVWVETEPLTIVVGNEKSGRRFTFWISPLKWLGANEEPRGLESIVALTEELMDWKGKTINDQAGRGLGGWLKWLRGAAATTTLHEARESLAASVGAEPPAPAKKLVTRAAKPVRKAKPIKTSAPKTLLFVNIALGLVVVGLGGWLWYRKNHPNPVPVLAEPAPGVSQSTPADAPKTRKPDSAPVPTPAESGMSESDRAFLASQRATKYSAELNPNFKKPAANPGPAPVADPGGAIQWDNREAFIGGKTMVVEGVVQGIDPSNSGKTIYLTFSKTGDKSSVRAGMEIKSFTSDAVIGMLKPFSGKKIHATGTVVIRDNPGGKRPEIIFDSPSDIKVVE